MRARQVDANQVAVVAALRAAGATVQHLHAVGAGCPDLLIGIGGANYLLELKDGAKPASAQKLTPDQVAFHRAWRGQVLVIRSAQQAFVFARDRRADARRQESEG